MESNALIKEFLPTQISDEDMNSCFNDGKLKLDAFRELLVARRHFDPSKWESYRCINHLTDGSDREDVEKAMQVVDERFKRIHDPFILAEAEIGTNIGYCAAFTYYCCLCTACLSCCIGPYFIKGYSEQLVERNEQFKRDLCTEYTK